MVSFTFFLCSSLLLSGVVFADTEAEIAEVPEVTEAAEVAEKDPVLKQAGKQAAIAGINVFNDVMDGRNLTDALLDRGIEALGKVDGTVPEYGKGFLEKVKEFKEGEQIEKIASSIAVAAHKKFEGKLKDVDDIYKEVGEDNIKKFVEGVTKVIKKAIAYIFKKKNAKLNPEEPLAEPLPEQA